MAVLNFKATEYEQAQVERRQQLAQQLGAVRSVARPPGRAGELYDWLLSAAMLPIPEAAVVTTLGTLAGIAGLAYLTPAPTTGLNVYLILVARSATGKEMLHDGAGSLLLALRQRVSAVNLLINFDDYASGPALAKQCVASMCFTNFCGEFGRKLKRMANPKDAPMADLRTTYTKLYSKSGPRSFVGDLVYSKERHAITGAVAVSLVGETTPGTLRASMTQDMMEDGFLSRFGWLEYTGDRPDDNPHASANANPPEALVSRLAELALQAVTMIGNKQTCEVQQTAEAASLLDAFKARCNTRIKAGGDDESRRQVWNRAHLKAKKYASLLAVFDDHRQPCIQPAHAAWAVDMVERDAALFEQCLTNGDVGSDAPAQEKKLLHILRQYIDRTVPLKESYGIPSIMHTDGVVPRRYLQMRTSDTAAFKAHPLGSTVALNNAIQSCVDSGYIVEIPRDKAGALYTFQGRCYRVVLLPGTN